MAFANIFVFLAVIFVTTTAYESADTQYGTLQNPLDLNIRNGPRWKVVPIPNGFYFTSHEADENYRFAPTANKRGGRAALMDLLDFVTKQNRPGDDFPSLVSIPKKPKKPITL